jgi:hypothetical protein
MRIYRAPVYRIGNFTPRGDGFSGHWAIFAILGIHLAL